ncbi:hypothetical protein BGW38_008543 [Lunasporangiospora selenospora]|uniref:Uncharacterized protein n=1 Tax=Lunasporangiospora selenospora TaxID=979761 RepID=A0A9P6K9L2_9FUNG|nr:hypothetical protein BGW38_008543 [Lunasporangiospora selenospora]
MTSTQSPPSPPPQFGLHSLHTHITSFTLPRRREEYRKLGFTLHQEFSRALVILMEQSQESLSRLEIQDNFLDLEMTELIFCIVRYGRHLERLLYDGNRDGGFVAPEVVSAITAACPNIRSFRGKHAISDTVLRRMLSGWEQLRSITLAPFHSPALGPKEISLEGLWSLLECSQVERLELLDLDCLSNENLAKLVERVKQLEALSIDRWRSSTLPLSTSSAHAHPLAHHGIRFPSNNNSSVDASMSRPGSPATTTRPLPGASVRHLTLTKFTSMPLTLPGFGLLLKLFPNLETLVFTTNYFAYDHQFRGLTKEIYETEVEMVERTVQAEMVARWGNAVMSPVLSSVSSWSWPNGIKSSSLPSQTPAAASFPWLDMRLRWKADWNAPWTEEQRLRAGIMRA